MLEHIKDPGVFAFELFNTAKQAVILSVPWKWAVGSEPSHLHDPVDSVKLRRWTKRDPDTFQIYGTLPRAVAVYYQPNQ